MSAIRKRPSQSDSRAGRAGDPVAAHKLDKGNEHFDPSTLAFTSMDVGNDATNVIPGEARAAFNIRFNDKHTPESLLAGRWTAPSASPRKPAATIDFQPFGERHVVPHPPGKFTQLVSDTVAASPARRRSFPPAAALRTRVSSRIIARWWNWAWRAPPCTRPTNACR